MAISFCTCSSIHILSQLTLAYYRHYLEWETWIYYWLINNRSSKLYEKKCVKSWTHSRSLSKSNYCLRYLVCTYPKKYVDLFTASFVSIFRVWVNIWWTSATHWKHRLKYVILILLLCISCDYSWFSLQN